MNRLAVFDSVHQAIRAEKLMRLQGIAVELVPTPREISASCGQSLLFSSADQEEVLQAMAREAVVCSGIYAADAESRVYERLNERGSFPWNSF